MSELTGMVAQQPGAGAANMYLIEEKIAELMKKAAQNGGQMSDDNARMLQYFQYLKRFNGRDVHLVVVPHGALTPIGGAALRGKVVEMKPDHAANLLSFATARNQQVRIARPEEVKAYRAYNLRARELAMQRHANEAAAAMQRHVAALSSAIPAGYGNFIPAPTQVEPPPMFEVEPEVELPEIEVDLPDLASLGPVPTNTAGTDAHHMHAVSDLAGADPRIGQLGTKVQGERLLAAGYRSIDAIAQATVAELQQRAPQLGNAAPRLIAAANEMVAKAAAAQQ